MTLSLSAKPQIVAREAKPGTWNWDLTAEELATLRLAQSDGLVGTAQHRDNGGQFVLLAWSVPQQREAAKPRQAKRDERRLRQQLLAPEGYTPRSYRPQAVPRAGRTHAPYEGDPAHW